MILDKVVLPLPFEPIMPCTLPASNSALFTFSRKEPCCFFKSVIFIFGSLFSYVICKGLHDKCHNHKDDAQHYARFKEHFGKRIAGFFTDEPRLGNIPGYDRIIGSCPMPLPCSAELLAALDAIGRGTLPAVIGMWPVHLLFLLLGLGLLMHNQRKGMR